MALLFIHGEAMARVRLVDLPTEGREEALAALAPPAPSDPEAKAPGLRTIAATALRGKSWHVKKGLRAGHRYLVTRYDCVEAVIEGVGP